MSSGVPQSGRLSPLTFSEFLNSIHLAEEHSLLPSICGRCKNILPY